MNDGAVVRLLSSALRAGIALVAKATDTIKLYAAEDDTPIHIGDGTKSFDVKIFGNTASDHITHDASANEVSLNGAVKLAVKGTGSLGYGTGSGGAVTQATSASTGVTLNKTNGQITTVALTTAAAAEERFTVTNSTVAATDAIVLSTTYDGAGTPVLSVQKVAAGAFDIVITNVHAANAFDAAMIINFAVIKAVAA